MIKLLHGLYILNLFNIPWIRIVSYVYLNHYICKGQFWMGQKEYKSWKTGSFYDYLDISDLPCPNLSLISVVNVRYNRIIKLQ